MTDTCDIVVIGGGPAGSMAARSCARRGLATVLLEKHAPLRHKLCGGAVSQRAAAAIDFEIQPDIVERQCHALHVRYRGDGCVVRQSEPMAMLVSRERFDEFLTRQAAAAGALVRYEQPALDLTVEPSCVRVTTPAGTVQARAAVIADGANSILACRVRPPFSRRQLAACVAVDIPADDATIERVCGGSLVIDYGLTPSGYLWLFPKAGHISAGLGQLCGQGERMKQTLLAHLRRNGLATDAPLRGAVVPLKAATDRIVGDRLLLAGDAGGFVDAFTGEGIHFAMLSGMLAGEALAEAAGRDDFRRASLDSYRRRCQASFLGELRAAICLTNMMYRFPNMLLRTAVRHEGVVRKYLECFDQPGGRHRFAAWFALRLPKLWLT